MDTSGVLLIIALAVVVVALTIVLLTALRRRGGTSAALSAEEIRAILAETMAANAAQPDSGVRGVPGAGSDHGAGGVAPGASTETSGVARSAEPEAAPRHSASDEVDAIKRAARDDVERILRRARADAEAITAAAAAERERLAEEAQALADDKRAVAADRDRLRADRADVMRQRDDLAEREHAVQGRIAAADARQRSLDQSRSELLAARAELDAARAELAAERAEQLTAHEAELVRLSSLTAEEARAELLASQEELVRRDAALMIRRIETETQTTAKERARRIVADAIQRIASDQTSQSVVSVLQLPSDELKGRIIGREGRNIRTFETVTGVNVIIDDTPEAVLLSCFDPVRREIARVTLQSLIDDGRIHPHRIEEAFERAQEEVDALCARAAEDALLDVGITDLHPDLVSLVGQLKYRSSYGQNVLAHLVETSHIARMMAAELGVDGTIAARGAFLHDIGKALTHEAQGSHAIVGEEIARMYGESAEVVHCIEAHHDEVPPTTVEAVLTQAADACSGGRPGARRESLESYVKRLEHIEAIASAKKGVDKVFAMQAGRELRVMVKPEIVDDLEAHVMAREVAKQIEEELTYPGQVRVTVIRESRATEVAR
jgi:ribonuclease Y